LVIKSKTVTGLGLCGKFNRLENHKLISSLDFLFLLYQDKRKARVSITNTLPNTSPPFWDLEGF
jgi:hypothetical protein